MSILGGAAAVAAATVLAPTASAATSGSASLADLFGSTGSAASSASAASFGPTIGPDAIPVYQIPAIGFMVNGLVVPDLYVGAVRAETSGVPGETVISAPFTPEACSATAGGALVRVGYLNPVTGDRGSVVVKPCVNFLEPAPERATVRTGAGPVVFTVSVTGSDLRPGAGQPSLPGVGLFNVP